MECVAGEWAPVPGAAIGLVRLWLRVSAQGHIMFHAAPSAEKQTASRHMNECSSQTEDIACNILGRTVHD